MDRNVRMGLLLDVYGALLTDKQASMLALHYNEDLSLAEIAQQEHISRQGVYDTIRRGEAQLIEMEARAGLLKRILRTREILCAGRTEAQDAGADTRLFDAALAVWEDE